MIIRKQVVVEKTLVVCDLCEMSICEGTETELPASSFGLKLGGDGTFVEQHFCNSCGAKVYHAITSTKNFWRTVLKED